MEKQKKNQSNSGKKEFEKSFTKKIQLNFSEDEAVASLLKQLKQARFTIGELNSQVTELEDQLKEAEDQLKEQDSISKDKVVKELRSEMILLSQTIRSYEADLKLTG